MTRRQLMAVATSLMATLCTGWVFVRYKLGPEGYLQLSVVSNEALKGLKVKTALRAIAKRAGDEKLYELVAVCTAGSG